MLGMWVGWGVWLGWGMLVGWVCRKMICKNRVDGFHTEIKHYFRKWLFLGNPDHENHLIVL